EMRLNAGPAHLRFNPPPGRIAHVRRGHCHPQPEALGQVCRGIVLRARAMALEMVRLVQGHDPGIETLYQCSYGHEVVPAGTRLPYLQLSHCANLPLWP